MTAEPDLPEPLVPEDVDLTGYAFTPLFRQRLFGSVFHATATDGEWRAGVTLWLKSWDQQPAGTLPPHDALLARLAELSADAWATVREVAMHGWVLCQDGRLHHAVVAEGVLEAWATRRKNSEKGAAGAAKRWGRKIKTRNSTGNSPAIARPMPKQWPGYSNGEGQGEGKQSSVLRTGAGAPKVGLTPISGGANPHIPPPETGAKNPVDSPSTDPKTWLFQTGLGWLIDTTGKSRNQIAGLVGKWLKDLAGDPTRLKRVIENAMEENPIDPIPWIAATVKARAVNNPPPGPQQPPEGDPYHMDETDQLLAKVFGADATDTLLFKRGLLKSWPTDRLGPPPGDAGCKIKPVILSRHGYADAAIFDTWQKGQPA